MNYTPGPWRADKAPGDKRTRQSIRSIGGARPTAPLPEVCVVTRGHLPFDEVAGNVTLLEAAPDLYEACRLMAACHPYNVVVHRALAKAEGRKPEL